LSHSASYLLFLQLDFSKSLLDAFESQHMIKSNKKFRTEI
jgi:hypothetical protein